MDSPPLTITTGIWHDIVARRSGSSWAMNYDDQTVTTATFSDTIWATMNPLLIGKRVSSPLNQVFPVNGLLDETAIWTRALSDSELATIYNGGRGMVLMTIPEPASVIMLGIGIFGLACFGWSRRRVKGEIDSSGQRRPRNWTKSLTS